MQFRDLRKQYEVLKQDIDSAIANVIESSRFISGPQVKELEQQLAEYVGVKHCITCANGTDALTLALKAWGIGAGDVVFVPDFTFFSSAEVIALEGALPVFVDVLEDTYNINPDKLEKAIERVKQEARTLSVLDIVVGIVLAALLIVLRKPLLSLYTLTPAAYALADSLILLQALIMVGMSYQMPVSMGIIQGGGDAKFTMKMNLICTYLIVMPLTFMGAFWWKVPVVALVFIIQSDQLFKCLPVWLRFKNYTWIRKLTR